MKDNPIAAVQDKVFHFIEDILPGEVKAAGKAFRKTHLGRAETWAGVDCDDRAYHRAFISFFLFEYDDLRPLELAYRSKKFTKDERHLIKGLKSSFESFFIVEEILGKDILLQDCYYRRSYRVTTIDFNLPLKPGMCLIARLAPLAEKAYIFFGNVQVVSCDDVKDALEFFDQEAVFRP